MQRLARDDFPRLLDALRDRGFGLVGPTMRDGAIVYDEIEGAADLPIGWTDEQAPGRYRLRRRDDDAYFGYNLGPRSWKELVFPPRETLVRIRTGSEGFAARSAEVDAPPLALIGARACELSALGILDRVFVGGPHVDPRYRRRRDRLFVVAVDCLEAGDLCFCTAMGTGPEAETGFDLRLCELPDGFLVEAGTDAGAEVLAALGVVEAGEGDHDARSRGLDRAREAMDGRFDPGGVPELLLGNLDHPRWDDVAARCLACGNCTQVCPTCFCFDVNDHTVPGLEASEVTRQRHWDSCYGAEHSTIHGGAFQPTIRDRYRQWLTHKLASWVGQFGTSGCVGCGRCIAWCPVGIDLREEVAAIREGAAPPIAKLEPPVHEPVEGDAMRPLPARVIAVRREQADVVTLVIEPPGPYRHQPGQFNMLSIPGVGDIPVSIAGHEGAELLHTIRAVGAASGALVRARPGSVVGLRGPFGRGWPMAELVGRDVTVIAGGLGLAPLRETLVHLIEHPEDHPRVRLLYGARTPSDILYDRELLQWNRRVPHFKASVTVDHAPAEWTGHVGVVTRLMRRKDLPRGGIYLVCGPEVMMRFVVDVLHETGVSDEHIYLAMERNMKCAAGLCGRCQYGPYFVCKDGPVFRHDRIRFLFGHPGF